MSLSLRRFWNDLRRRFKTVHSFYKESPAICYVVCGILLLLILIGSCLHLGFARVVGSRGAMLLDLALAWQLLRLIVRMIVFPGSVTLVQRNTEATYRVEMARQYASHLRQFHLFLRHVAKHSVGVPRGLSADGVLRGFAVIECLSRSFRMQEHDKVRLNAEQVQMFNMAQHIERWLLSARIQKRTEGLAKPAGDGGARAPSPGCSQETMLLVEWLRDLTKGSRIPYGSSPLALLMGVELAEDGQDAVRHMADVDQLISMLNDLRNQKSGWWESTMRFIRVPTVGSLHQLRTELQMRYHSVQCWVPSRGSRQLDGMFIPCSPGDSDSEDDHESEKAPLNSSAKTAIFKGPTLVWCNPNAGYMEIMVYQSHVMNFYLQRGCNIFLFNYSGFGRSSGRPSPSHLAEDGVSVIEFLRKKGITQIGVHGRSIGGIVACHVAQQYPDLVKFIVADRTFSTLASTAKYLYGDWAAKGLTLSGTWADNMPAFLEARCYKVLICDPKDAMITELASLRSAVALEAVNRMAPEERLNIEDGRLLKLSEAWRFIVALFTATEEEDDAALLEERPSGVSARVTPSARQPAVSSPEKAASPTDVRLKVGDGIESGKKNGGISERIGAQWIEDHGSFVRATLGPFTDQIRTAIDVVVEHLDAGGVCLHDVLGDNPEFPCFALRSWLANLQVWGSIGDQREAPDFHAGSERSAARSQAGVSDQEIEKFLRKSDCSFNFTPELSERRLAELEHTLSPAAVSNYSRLMARSQVLLVRRELRRRLVSLQQALRQDAVQPTEQAQLLRSSLLEHLGEVEGFVTTIGRFFKSVDLMLPCNKHASGADGVSVEATPLSDSSDEKVDGLLGMSSQPGDVGNADRSDAPPRPIIDIELCGHIIHTDCGHNGVLDESEFRLLGLHMRAAKFGRVFSEAS